jgi:5-methylcytosine-specific restriction endonuclease McrA
MPAKRIHFFDCVEEIECACGCGQMRLRYNRGRPRNYIPGHQCRGRPKPESWKRKMMISNKGHTPWCKGFGSSSEGYEQVNTVAHRRFIRSLKDVCGWACERCGESPEKRKMLHAHHIDEDPQNNKRENLIVLCPKCHRGLHRDLINIRRKSDGPQRLSVSIM